MLTINQKIEVFESYDLLTKKIRQDKIRADYKLLESKKTQKNVVCQFSLITGNGYVCGRHLSEGHKYKLDKRGWINIKNFNKEELVNVIDDSIKSLLR
jgi:hypothetical protein